METMAVSKPVSRTRKGQCRLVLMRTLWRSLKTSAYRGHRDILGAQ